MEIGRDLIRALQDVAQIPEFQKIWSDLLENPNNFDPKFEGYNEFSKSVILKLFLKFNN